MPDRSTAPEGAPIILDPEEAQLVGAAIQTMLRMHDAAASLWEMQPVPQRARLEALAHRLSPVFAAGGGTGDLTRDQERVVEHLSLQYGRAAVQRCNDGTGDVMVLGLTDDIQREARRVTPAGQTAWTDRA